MATNPYFKNSKNVSHFCGIRSVKEGEVRCGDRGDKSAICDDFCVIYTARKISLIYF